ncbi:unnamed protein product [Rhizophagus irregularis]|nr:unnamed protein product [Rhizophagus irregularis]
MSKLNRDVLYLIFKELHDDKYTLHSCLLVNKTWCEVAIPILWRNPWKYLNYSKGKFLLDHLNLNAIKECYTNINDSGLAGLIEICKSVKELELIINKNDNNYGVTRLIETQKSLFSVHYIIFRSTDNVSFHTALETSLIKHANTIQHFKITNQPGTYFLSCFINLKSLELDGYFGVTWYCLKNLSLPSL